MASRIAWRFKGNEYLKNAAAVTLRKMAFELFEKCNPHSEKKVLFPGPGEATAIAPFKTCPEAIRPVIKAVMSGEANAYAPSAGILKARSAVADYLNKDLEVKLTPNDVYITAGCNQAIEIIVAALANNPNANILLPQPGYPHYDGRAIFSRLGFRKYNLVPENQWEIDLDGLDALVDVHTVAMVLINPNNPCGNVYSSDHLQKVAEKARELGIMIISDEVYDHIVFGDKPFVPMRKFASIAPVVTLGSISKGWLVPGWRIGWMAMNDPKRILRSSGVLEAIENCLDLSTQPSLLLQEALPGILENTPPGFFKAKIEAMKENVEFSCERLKDIECLTYPMKPESCSYLWVKLNTTMLEDIGNEFDFCSKLVTEENLVLIPGRILGKEDWVRISIGTDKPVLEDMFDRLKNFCDKHAKSSNSDSD